ncbi:putative secreted glycosidase ARB_07629 [Colletotrichum liriopes]|uniref:Secreted glycosidase ARB_07629 n=1 Tax=Colletotrichum liriopes TaxID=708192 RepID=A0AA37GJ97_9PEZI|nr:putative secreted glycosidase ARB_07629 [Colletotrichum liriopes]
MAVLIPAIGLSRPVRLLVFAVVVVCLFTWWPFSESPGLSRFFSSKPNLKAQHAILKYVDPLIGTVNGGHVFPGASLPYGWCSCLYSWSHLVLTLTARDGQALRRHRFTS